MASSVIRGDVGFRFDCYCAPPSEASSNSPTSSKSCFFISDDPCFQGPDETTWLFVDSRDFLWASHELMIS